MPKGGLRPGSGRKKNSSIFGENTVARRIPISLANKIDHFVRFRKEEKDITRFELGPDLKQLGSLYPGNLSLSLYENRVSAGFPSPADDHLEASLDLNQHLIKHPAATFFVRASGESMINAGINDNDILVVDRSLEPKHGDIIIAALNGELTVKRLHTDNSSVILNPANPDYPPINITEEMDFLIWGVVTSVVHQYKGQR